MRNAMEMITSSAFDQKNYFSSKNSKNQNSLFKMKLSIYNHWQNTWQEVGISSKIGQDHKVLIPAFV